MGLELDENGKPYISRNGFGPLSETDLGTRYGERCLAVDNEVKEKQQTDTIKQLIDGLSTYCKDLSLEEVSRVLREPTPEIHEMVNNLLNSSSGFLSGAKDYQEAVEKIIDIIFKLANRQVFRVVNGVIENESKDSFIPFPKKDLVTGHIEHPDAKGYTIAGYLIDNDSRDVEVATVLKEDSPEVKEAINALVQPSSSAEDIVAGYQEAVKMLGLSGFKVDSMQVSKINRDPETGHIASIEYDDIASPGLSADNNFKFPEATTTGGLSVSTEEVKSMRLITGMQFDAQQKNRTVQFGMEYKISKTLPIVDKHLDVAPNGWVIKVSDDKKEKINSWGAELVFELDSIGSNSSGYGNIDVKVIGYGRDKEEALEELDKLYLHMLNKFMDINKY